MSEHSVHQPGRCPRCDAENRIYERAEEAFNRGLPIEDALQAVRDGYSSAEADRMIAEDL